MSPSSSSLTRNRSDSDAELEAIRVAALEAGATAAVPSWHWGEGGKGAIELAKAVVSTCNADTQSFRFLYDLKTSIEEKIEIVSKEIYGADGIELSEDAQKKVKLYDSQARPLAFGGLFNSFQGIWESSGLHCQNSVLSLRGSQCKRCPNGVQNPRSRLANFSWSWIHRRANWGYSNYSRIEHPTQLLQYRYQLCHWTYRRSIIDVR
jgi:hypothetical protein